jgi:hypothetical protein
MLIDNPTWTILGVECSVCSQIALQLIACPGCHRLALGCEECAADFFDLAASLPISSSAVCPDCAKHPLSAFVAATSEETQVAGLVQHQYA